MATQKRKYSGKNIQNNRVIVDYDKKVVRFTPLKTKTQFYWSTVFLTNHFAVYGAFTAVWVYPTVLITLLITTILDLEPTPIFNIIAWTVIGLMITLSISTTAKLLSKKFREEDFPEYNANMVKAMKELSTFGKKTAEKYTVINKRTLNPDNTILIPLFSNVQFNYKATKDFGKRLKKIEIQEIFLKQDEGDWFARVHFNGRPINGQFSIRYI